MESKETPPGGAPVSVVPPVDSNGVFMAGGEGRVAETEYIHRRGMETERSHFDRKVRALIDSYRKQMTPEVRTTADGSQESVSPLRAYVEGLDAEMHHMRMNGIDSIEARSQYEKLRKAITQSFEKESALKQKLNSAAGGFNEAVSLVLSGEVRNEAAAVLEAVQDEHEKLEDAYHRAISQHNEWAKGRHLFRRESDLGPWQPERRLKPHEYDERVIELMTRALQIEDAVPMANGAEASERLRAQVVAVKTRLLALDTAANLPEQPGSEDEGQVENYPAVSRERKSLEQMLTRIEERLSTRRESAERFEQRWVTLERSLMPYVKAYAEIRSLYELGRVTRDDLEEAWKEKRGAYQRISDRIAKLENVDPFEREELMRRAQETTRPDEPLPQAGQGTPELPSVQAESEEHLPELELMGSEDYNDKVRTMMRRVDDIATTVDTLEQQKKLTAQARQELLDQLRVFPAELLELDEHAQDPMDSRDRRDLVTMMKELRDRLEFHIDEPTAQAEEEQLPELELIPEDQNLPVQETPTTSSASVDDARKAYVATKTAYMNVQHRLTVDQRRSMRTRIAQLAGLVRSAELLQNVARATEHAPALAHAALASVRVQPRTFEVRTIPGFSVEVTARKPRRSMFRALGNAFKLKE